MNSYVTLVAPIFQELSYQLSLLQRTIRMYRSQENNNSEFASLSERYDWLLWKPKRI